MPTAPVAGKVAYEGKPLDHGSVVLVPDVGPPARGSLQPDGTFLLSTYSDGDGALLGKHRIQVLCIGPPPTVPPGEEPLPGKSLIPTKYSRYDTSGLTIEVKPGNEPLMIELVGPRP